MEIKRINFKITIIIDKHIITDSGNPNIRNGPFKHNVTKKDACIHRMTTEIQHRQKI